MYHKSLPRRSALRFDVTYKELVHQIMLAIYLKDGEVQVRGVAAGLVASRASVQGVQLLRLGRRPVIG